MRIGVFGGTFDPVHQGHLILAEQCREQARLDQVWFVPAARPPHKMGQTQTPFARRVDMLSLAIAGQAAFRIEEIENEREGPSFMADTLEILHSRHPDHSLHLVIGSDCLPDLARWYDPQRIVKLAGLVVAGRPNWPFWSAEQIGRSIGLPSEFPVQIQDVEMPQFELASRDLRQRIAEGRSIRFLVPRAVECYIETHGLYRSGSEP